MSGFVLGPVIEYLFVYEIVQSRTIAVFTAQFASQNPHNFLFFPAPCQKACYYLTNLDLKSTFLIFAFSEKSTSLPLRVKMNQHFNLFPPEINIFFGCFFEKSTSLLPRINQQF